MVRTCAAAVLTLVAVSSAAAESGPPFATLDRASAGNRFGAALGLQIYDDSDSDGGNVEDRVARRIELDGEYAFTGDDGVTASLPVVWIPHSAFRLSPTDSDDGGSDRDHFGLGAAQLGVYHRVRLTERDGVFLRGGFILPTDGFIPGTGYESHVAVHGTIFQRLEDPATAGDVFWLRTGAVYRRVGESLAAQLDLLVDWPLADVYGKGGGAPARLHAGGGLAYVRGPFHIGGELLLSGFPLFERDELDLAVVHENFDFYENLADSTYFNDTLLAATLSTGASVGGLDMFIWYTNPLDDYIRSHFRAFGLGIQTTF